MCDMELRDAISLRVYDYRLEFTMGIDYDAVGGVGISEDRFVNRFIELGKFTEEEWDDNRESCLDEIGIGYRCSGDSYADEREYHLMVPGKNLQELVENAPVFISKLKELGIDLAFSDLLVIEEPHVW